MGSHHGEGGLQEVALFSPDLLVVTDQLVQGYRPSLVNEVKESSPDTKCLMVLRRETAEVVEESLKAGCQGICFQGNIGYGDKDFMRALQAIDDNAVDYQEEVRNKAGYVSGVPLKSEGSSSIC